MGMFSDLGEAGFHTKGSSLDLDLDISFHVCSAKVDTEDGFQKYNGRGIGLGEVIPERHFEYLLLFRCFFSATLTRVETQRSTPRSLMLLMLVLKGDFFCSPLQLRGESRPIAAAGSSEGPPPCLRPPCRSHLYPPSTWTGGGSGADLPEAELVLEWAHGTASLFRI